MIQEVVNISNIWMSPTLAFVSGRMQQSKVLFRQILD
uniref:Uncharacterized protein n=1 Tax=Arundo donax TaxID=35708 RepID=A0A0A8XS87_ARUDO